LLGGVQGRHSKTKKWGGQNKVKGLLLKKKKVKTDHKFFKCKFKV